MAAREPFPLSWVGATDDLGEAVARVPELGAIQTLSRGALRWRIALPEDGSLPFDGVMPALIEWLGGAHPCDRLEDRGCELVSVAMRHPAASEVAMMLQVLEYEGWDTVEGGSTAPCDDGSGPARGSGPMNSPHWGLFFRV